ncbi:hypothetical protein AB3A32_002628 [Vibrio alginolyticus]
MSLSVIDELRQQALAIQNNEKEQLAKLPVLEKKFDDKFELDIRIDKADHWGGLSRNIRVTVNSKATNEELMCTDVKASRDTYREAWASHQNPQKLIVHLGRTSPQVQRDFKDYMKSKKMDITLKQYLINKTNDYLLHLFNTKQAI